LAARSDGPTKRKHIVSAMPVDEENTHNMFTANYVYTTVLGLDKLQQNP